MNSPTISLCDDEGIQLYVPSSKEDDEYVVEVFYPDGDLKGRIVCSCPDYLFRKRACKHIRQGVEFLCDIAEENNLQLVREEVMEGLL